ncbi:Ribosome recycling factor [Candidatus Portiera aleyrodidarum]|uniref:Ribosome recycling factor n=1 Tax=Candidatus Portiera aleyrodidarum TV TaxID=1297582 RepID=A0A8D3X758_9GAMM|nr:ribosome recycling factor [Candidatus Portiera aleyrodidarum]AGI27022.1 ribosome recycling factor [Candidatus Portiera aleyrodidarum TV]CEI58977.1 Ribosome recycling factor [Candidatus Portiera aleyrodidarum]
MKIIMDTFIKNTSVLMEKSIKLLNLNFNKIRTNKINPEIIDNIYISYHGKKTYLKHLSNIYVENSHTLIINPWDKQIINAIKKAIFINLDINPIINTNNIKVIFPKLTEETRKRYIMIARSFAENSKIYIRNTRRDINKDIKTKLQTNIYNMDEANNLKVILQKLTDKYINIITKLLKQKENDLIKI